MKMAIIRMARRVNHKLFMMLLAALLTFCFQILSFNCLAQDIHFSQYNNSPLTLNPSMAGASNGDLRVIANFRDQWQSISPYKTFAFSGDMGLFKPKRTGGYLGAGISFFSDKAGTTELSLNQINLSVAYHATLSANNTLSAGIQGGFAFRSINLGSNIKWDNQYNGTSYDPNLPSGETIRSNNISYPDFAAGMQWTYKKRGRNTITNNDLRMNAGISAYHLSQPNQSFYDNTPDKLPMRLVVHGCLLAGIMNSKTSIEPSFEYMQQGPQKEIVFGCLLQNKLLQESLYTENEKSASFSFGAYYRWGDAIIPSLEIERSFYSFGISYDINLSQLSSVTSCRGGFEFSLKFIGSELFSKK